MRLAGVLMLLAAIAPSALAAPVATRDGLFQADVSAGELNRLTIEGEKIVKVRLMGDGQGPRMVVEADEQTGDAFIGFQGEVTGRAFSAFFITERGRTVQGVLSPRDEAAQTVMVKLSPGDAATGAGALTDEASPAAPPVNGEGRARPEAYPEILTALIRVMFNGQAPEGVKSTRVDDRMRIAGPFELRTLEVYSVEGLKGTVLSLRNITKVGQPLSARTFLLQGVLAAAVSHESVEPGHFARVYLVEPGQ